MFDPQAIGKTIQRIRNEKNIGFRELGRLSEISPASIVAIEKGKSSPTLFTLSKILKALKTDFLNVFAEASKEQTAPVFRARDLHGVSDEYREYIFLLPQRNDIKFEMLRETISADEKTSEWDVHDADMAGVVLSGGPRILEIQDSGTWTLRKGDAFYVKAGMKHKLINKSQRAMKLVTVYYPPRF